MNGTVLVVLLITILFWITRNAKDKSKRNHTICNNNKQESKMVDSEHRNNNIDESKNDEKEKLIEKTTGIKIEIINVEDIILGEEQKRVYDFMSQTEENLFITGKAGTGKSVLLQYFVRHTNKQVAVVAPTGVAALNIGGQTIHSFFGLKLGIQNTDDISLVRDMGNKKREILKTIDILIIDEVSMVSADVMDMIDAKLKYARESYEPFGGCQIILFGDLYQLPPVVTAGAGFRFLEDKYRTIYFFGAQEIRKHPFRRIELQEIFRQIDDPEFVEILNKIRIGDVDNKVLEDINFCCVRIPKDEQYVTLTGNNASADRINREKLNSLQTKEYTYIGEVKGDIKQSDMPTALELKLKVGAHVMMLKNDHTDNTSTNKKEKARWVNGTLGIVSELSEQLIKVEINGVKHVIEKETWEKYQYMYDSSTKTLVKEVVATFRQYPLRLAYAITIHKSQGQTYETVKIDLSQGAFANGQVYVALSRCRNMKSLYLTVPLKLQDIRVSQEVKSYMKECI